MGKLRHDGCFSRQKRFEKGEQTEVRLCKTRSNSVKPNQTVRGPMGIGEQCSPWSPRGRRTGRVQCLLGDKNTLWREVGEMGGPLQLSAQHSTCSRSLAWLDEGTGPGGSPRSAFFGGLQESSCTEL